LAELQAFGEVAEAAHDSGGGHVVLASLWQPLRAASRRKAHAKFTTKVHNA
jgi:hypothetical protein